jgi:nicotinamide-nucleotide amidase
MMSKLENLEKSIEDQAGEISEMLLGRGWRAATAESCTGGWIAKALTSVVGSSGWFEAGLVTYSNEAKINFLSVSPMTIEKYGAVSSETAKEMVQGLLRVTGVDVGVSVTGIAGPTGGTVNKPVGTVWFGFSALGQETVTTCLRFDGSRDVVRLKAVNFGLARLIKMLS